MVSSWQQISFLQFWMQQLSKILHILLIVHQCHINQNALTTSFYLSPNSFDLLFFETKEQVKGVVFSI